MQVRLVEQYKGRHAARLSRNQETFRALPLYDLETEASGGRPGCLPLGELKACRWDCDEHALTLKESGKARELESVENTSEGNEVRYELRRMLSSTADRTTPCRAISQGQPYHDIR